MSAMKGKRNESLIGSLTGITNFTDHLDLNLTSNYIQSRKMSTGLVESSMLQDDGSPSLKEEEEKEPSV